MVERQRGDVLIVDDDESIRKIIGMRLMQEQMNVTAASSGEEAVSILAERSFQAVVMDIHLEDMDGRVLLEKMRKMGRSAQRVILLSGDVERGARLAAEHGERVVFLPKPFHAEEIIRAILPCSEEPGAGVGIGEVEEGPRAVARAKEQADVEGDAGRRADGAASPRVLTESDGLRCLALEIDRCRRYDGSMSLLKIDPELRAVLEQALLDERNQYFRKIDMLFRNGDGGGIVILPATDRQGAKLFVQQLLSRLRLYEGSMTQHPVAVCSFGISTFVKDGSTSDELLRAAHADYATSRQAAAPWHEDQGGRDVLIVDDIVDIATLLTQRLLKCGYRARVASTMAGAFEELQRRIPEIVLLDLALPDGNGREVLSWIRANPATRNLPVVILSAIALKEEIEEGFVRGANSYLSKPYSMKELLACIELLLAEVGSEKGPDPAFMCEAESDAAAARVGRARRTA